LTMVNATTTITSSTITNSQSATVNVGSSSSLGAGAIAVFVNAAVAPTLSQVTSAAVCVPEGGKINISNGNNASVRVRLLQGTQIINEATVAANSQASFTNLANGTYTVVTLNSAGTTEVGRHNIVVNCDLGGNPELVRAQVSLICVPNSGKFIIANFNNIPLRVVITGPNNYSNTITVNAQANALVTGLIDGTYTVSSFTTGTGGVQVGATQTIIVDCIETPDTPDDNPLAGTLLVCKEGPAGSYNFSLTGGVSQNFSLAAGACRLFLQPSAIGPITITEATSTSTVIDRIVVRQLAITGTSTVVTSNTITGSYSATVNASGGINMASGAVVVFKNKLPPSPVPDTPTDNPLAGTLLVCKQGVSGNFNFTLSGGLSQTFSLASGNCRLFLRTGATGPVTITEATSTTSVLNRIEVRQVNTVNATSTITSNIITNSNSATVNVGTTTTPAGAIATFVNAAPPQVPPPPPNPLGGTLMVCKQGVSGNFNFSLSGGITQNFQLASGNCQTFTNNATNTSVTINEATSTGVTLDRIEVRQLSFINATSTTVSNQTITGSTAATVTVGTGGLNLLPAGAIVTFFNVAVSNTQNPPPGGGGGGGNGIIPPPVITVTQVGIQAVCVPPGNTLVITNPNSQSVEFTVTGPGGFTTRRSLGATAGTNQTSITGLANGTYTIQTLGATSGGFFVVGTTNVNVNCVVGTDVGGAPDNLGPISLAPIVSPIVSVINNPLTLGASTGVLGAVQAGAGGTSEKTTVPWTAILLLSALTFIAYKLRLKFAK